MSWTGIRFLYCKFRDTVDEIKHSQLNELVHTNDNLSQIKNHVHDLLLMTYYHLKYKNMGYYEKTI